MAAALLVASVVPPLDRHAAVTPSLGVRLLPAVIERGQGKART